MPLMHHYTEITVEEDLLPQIVRELLELAEDPNHVDVTHGTHGRVILAHSALAEKWYLAATSSRNEHDGVEALRDTKTSASDGEESQ